MLKTLITHQAHEGVGAKLHPVRRHRGEALPNMMRRWWNGAARWKCICTLDALLSKRGRGERSHKVERRQASHCSESSLTSRVGAKPYQSTRKEAQQYSKH